MAYRPACVDRAAVRRPTAANDVASGARRAKEERLMAQSGTISRAPRPSSLADVLDLILDKGLVIDAYVRVSVVGIELLTVDARVVVASVDTYLRFAEAVNRLDLTQNMDSDPPRFRSMSEGG